MSQPIPHPGRTASLQALWDWSIKLTQVLKATEQSSAPVLLPGTRVVADLRAAAHNTRALVTDSNATLAAGHGNIVAGGGANVVPVYYDGTNWRIG